MFMSVMFAPVATTLDTQRSEKKNEALKKFISSIHERVGEHLPENAQDQVEFLVKLLKGKNSEPPKKSTGKYAAE